MIQKGAYPMKLGTFLFVLLLALVVLGILINDTFRTHSDLARAQQTIASLQNDFQALQSQNQSLQEENKGLEASNSELGQKVQLLSSEVERLRTENATLIQSPTLRTPESKSSPDSITAQLASLVNSPHPNILMGLGLLLTIALAGSGLAVSGAQKIGSRLAHPHSYVVKVSRHELDLLIRHRRKDV